MSAEVRLDWKSAENTNHQIVSTDDCTKRCLKTNQERIGDETFETKGNWKEIEKFTILFKTKLTIFSILCQQFDTTSNDQYNQDLN